MSTIATHLAGIDVARSGRLWRTGSATIFYSAYMTSKSRLLACAKQDLENLIELDVTPFVGPRVLH